MKRVIVISEIGENHMGDVNIAKMLIEKAAESGADYVKFQSYKPETFRPEDPEYEWFRKVSLSDEAHYKLKEYADKCGISFLSTPFSAERAKFLCECLDLKKIKIASGIMLNYSILDYVNDRADEVFLSTGMADIQEIKDALSHLDKVKKCHILHCVTQYPCKDRDANLLAIKTLQQEFPGHSIGYSDHTIGDLAPLAAVALGAQVIEKHFTFDKNAKEGSDHVISLEPTELKKMIKEIERITTLLGNPRKMPTSTEKEIIDFVRNRFIS